MSQSSVACAERGSSKEDAKAKLIAELARKFSFMSPPDVYNKGTSDGNLDVLPIAFVDGAK
jgi:hypothetical protein